MVKTEESASTNLSDFWHRLAEEFRLEHAVCPTLRGDWNYVVASGAPGKWRLAGADSNQLSKFEALAARAASRLPGTDAGELLAGWLDSLMREHIHFEYGREGIEPNPDGSETHHLNGTISRLFEASAIYCSRLEARVLESELRAREQAASQPDDAKEQDAPKNGPRESATVPLPSERVTSGFVPKNEHKEGRGLAAELRTQQQAAGRAAGPASKDAGQAINRLREECRLTIEELADAIEATPRTVQRHLAGKNRPLPRLVAAYEHVFSRLLKRKIVI